MASDNLSSAEAQWREQFTAMQAALAELKLGREKAMLDGDDIDGSDFEGYSSGTSGQDVWDFISDDGEDDYSSDSAEADLLATTSVGHGAEWFSSKCADIAYKNGLVPDVFQTQLVSVLTSGRPEDELQSQLTDLVGFDDFDFIIEVLTNKDEIVSAVSAQSHQEEQSGRRLLTRAQREEALRARDLEHKTATLAPSQLKEPQYPHVYRSYSAGNSLSYTGNKYGLPSGSEHLQFDKYEEYSIPAGRKGTLGPGERLVRISELDGLCRNTFKGYKTLNRMQSLVFPVAYKTNENMLICAPTGAVRFSQSFHSRTMLIFVG
jgi:antiviral helicase SLH1